MLQNKKDNPILFRGEMIRPLLMGIKKQTRRIASPISPGIDNLNCRYRVDRLWVRETFAYLPIIDETIYRADNVQLPGSNKIVWTPSIHMSRNASRITLMDIIVRSERLQNISESDAKAEGVEPDDETGSYIDSYMFLWERMNIGNIEFGWDANPWVWVINFTVHKINIDDLIHKELA